MLLISSRLAGFAAVGFDPDAWRLPDGRRRADAPQRGGTSALISTQPNRII
jgi:hypothetical protein